MIVSAYMSIVRTSVALCLANLAACVVTSGPAPVAPPAAAPPATQLASQPTTAPVQTPAPMPQTAPAPAPAPEPLPPQPVFAQTPEPTEKPAEHPHGIARGVPKGLRPGHPESLWVWHDENGSQWHVRTTTHAQQHRFSGRVWAVDGSIADLRPSRIEFNDRIRLTGRNIEFDFHTKGGIDGFDFRTAGPQQCVQFAFFIDGHGDNGKVKVGAGDAHPRHHVFTLCP